jgi:hypothetical protein
MRILTRVDTAATKVWHAPRVGETEGEPDRVDDAAKRVFQHAGLIGDVSMTSRSEAGYAAASNHS